MQIPSTVPTGEPAAADSPGPWIPDSQPGSAAVSTTQGSLLHRWIPFEKGWRTLAKIYAGCVALTYLPALLVAQWSLRTDTGTALPFLCDWNFAFTFLVSFPMLVLLIVSDEHVLASALRTVWSSKVIYRDEADGIDFAARWTRYFGRVNMWTQTLGLVLCAVLSWFTLQVYVWYSAHFWAAPLGVVGPVGVVYIACITLLYAVITIFVARSIAVACFLGGLVKLVKVRLLPFHPDGSGGLQPVGRLGLRNQYTLTVLGLNIAILGAVTARYLATRGLERDLIVTAVFAYAVLGPIVFMGPLLPFRAAMRHSKERLMGELSARLRIDFTRIRGEFPDNGISAEDLETLQRLQKLGTMLEELPVWPFDARTLRTFATAYVIPFVLPYLHKAVEASVALLGQKI